MFFLNYFKYTLGADAIATGHYARTSQEDEDVFQQAPAAPPTTLFRNRFESRNGKWIKLTLKLVVVQDSDLVHVFFLDQTWSYFREQTSSRTKPSSSVRSPRMLCEKPCSRWLGSRRSLLRRWLRKQDFTTFCRGKRFSVCSRRIFCLTFSQRRQVKWILTWVFFVCFFQSMGICFIGERNFEDFILEVRKS